MDPDTSSGTRRELSKNIQNYAMEIVPDGKIGTIDYTLGESGNQLVKVAGYNHSMAKYMGICNDVLQLGIDDNGRLPVLIRGALCNQYDIGDSFTLTIGDDMHPLSVIVAGKLNSDFQLIVPSYGASEPVIDSFFASDIISDDPLENANAIIFCYSGGEDWLSKLTNPACFVFSSDKGVSCDRLNSHNGSIGGKFFVMEDMISNTITQNMYINRRPLSKVFASSIFTLVSLFGYVFLLFIRNRRSLGIYTILGMSRKCMYAVILLAIGLCVAAATILYTTFSTIAITIGLYPISDSSVIVLLYSIVLVFISLLTGTFACSLFISHWQPIQYLKGE